MNPPGKLIALAGPKYCGKSSVARHLITNHGFLKFSWADPIRAMLRILGVTDKEMSDPVMKEQPCAALGGKSPRYAMQTLGTEWGRDMIDPNIWVNIGCAFLTQALKDGKNLVLDDCRFDNEAEAWRKAGGVVIELQRMGYFYNNDHPSESGLSRHLINCTIASGSMENVIRDVEYVALTPYVE